MQLLAVSLNTVSSSLALRFVIDMLRQGSIFSYIVVEISWLCKFLCFTRSFCMLTVISYPLGPLVVKWIICRMDG